MTVSSHGSPVFRAAALIALGALLSGCAGMPPRNPAPVEEYDRARPLPGVPAVRAWSGSFSREFREDLLLAVEQARTAGGDPNDAPVHVLAISGGSDRGAFGAGFLNGWSDTGRRPQFRIVTGISAGALAAPFAFLGPEYDDKLTTAFTGRRAGDIYDLRFSGLWRDALADSGPLKRLIDHYYDAGLLRDVARAHERGRRLYVATTNLDADRLAVWNMGAIAASDHPAAPELFRRVILASSSVPGLFPPVLINVMIDGEPHDEMHVDGGVKAQLFLTAATLDLTRLRGELSQREGRAPGARLFVIRNGEVGPEPTTTPRKLRDIVVRSFDSLLKSQARNDLVRVHRQAESQGFEFNWVAIPSWFEPSGRFFDTEEMNRLFEIGRELGRNPDPWRQQPPDFDRD